MTAELCDCYPTKADGVLAVLAAAAQAMGSRPLSVWGIDGRFHELDEIRRRPVQAAAANWLALATAAARLVPDDRGLMIDIGSTTTDIIPLDRGRVAVRGRTDTERLQTGELVYAGIRRTPLCALATELPLWQGPPIGLAAELFATSLDVFLTLGDLLAISSLDLTTELLAALLPGFAVVHRTEDLWACRNLGQVPILAPGRFLEEFDDRGPDPLAASWDVTSDSIAARIAVLLGARRLILLKSVGLSADIDRGGAARLVWLMRCSRKSPASWRSWNLSVRVTASPWREFLPIIAEVPRPSEPDGRERCLAREGSTGIAGRQEIRPDGADPAVGWQPRNRYPEWTGEVPGTAVTHVKTRTRLSSSSRVMSQLKLISVDHPEVPALPISTRLRSQLVYFMTPSDTPGIPALGESEYWLSRSEVTRWLSEGVLMLVSPLDTENMTEVELSEEQEILLGWLDKHQVQHIRVVE